MKLFLLINFCFAIFELDPNNWNKCERGFWLVEFYSPDCGHCQVYQPIYEQVAVVLDKLRTQLEITVARFNCKEYREYCLKNQINGTPTLRLYDKGYMIGQHSAISFKETMSDILKDLENQDIFISYDQDEEDLHPLLKIADNTERAGKSIEITNENYFKTDSGIWLIKVFAEWCGHCKKLKPIWDEFAAMTSSIQIGEIDAVKSPELKKKLNVSGFPTIIVKENGVVSRYAGQRTLESFLSFSEKYHK